MAHARDPLPAKGELKGTAVGLAVPGPVCRAALATGPRPSRASYGPFNPVLLATKITPLKEKPSHFKVKGTAPWFAVLRCTPALQGRPGGGTAWAVTRAPGAPGPLAHQAAGGRATHAAAEAGPDGSQLTVGASGRPAALLPLIPLKMIV